MNAWAMVIFGEGRYAVTIPTELGRTGERHMLRKTLPSVLFLMSGFLRIIYAVRNAGKRSKEDGLSQSLRELEAELGSDE